MTLADQIGAGGGLANKSHESHRLSLQDTRGLHGSSLGTESSALFTLRLLTSLFAVAVTSLAALEIPPLKYEERTLDNGLHAIWLEDHSVPVTAIQVWYHVGSKDDPAGRSGFAHLFEHIMFKSTKRMPSEFLDRLTEDVGGQNNAYTANDVTVYHEVVPSNHLERLIWAEAERMAALTVDEANFKTERDVVKEEFRQSVLSQPFGEFGEFVQKKSFAQHPYKRPTIGNIAELDAASIEDVRAFHTTFYRPDNATLVVVGDFDPAALNGWIDRYFGPIAKPAPAIPRVTVKEPSREGEKTITEVDPKVPFPAIAVTFLGPAVTSKERAAWEVLETVLGHGDSSRLYRSLVYEKQLAQTAEFGADLREDLGLPTCQIVLASGAPVEKARAALLAEFDRIASEPISERELTTAKNQLLTLKLHDRETAEGKAASLGEAVVLLGDAKRANEGLSQLAEVTADQVLAAARACFTAKNRIVIEYTPAAAAKATKSTRK